MNSQNRAFLIFSGFNQRAVISFCRIAKENNIPFVVVALSMEDTIFLTDYKEHVVYVRKDRSLNIDTFVKIIEDIRNRFIFDLYTILPSSEALNRFLLENRQVFETLCCDIPLVSQELYELVSDKESFGTLCMNSGIKVPKNILEEDVWKRKSVVLKPKKYFSRQGKALYPWIIHSKNDLNVFSRECDIQDFYIQEYIDGKSYYLLYYIGKEGNVISYSQQNILQQGNGKSIVYATSSKLHLTSISDKFVQLFKKIGFIGPIMIELKEMNGELYMIEANPRLWGPIQLTIDCDVPILPMFIKECGFDIDIYSKDISESSYLWLGGIITALQRGLGIVMHEVPEKFDEIIEKALVCSEIYKRNDTLQVFDLENELFLGKVGQIDEFKREIRKAIQ